MKKIFVRIITFVLICCMLVPLSACGDKTLSSSDLGSDHADTNKDVTVNEIDGQDSSANDVDGNKASSDNSDSKLTNNQSSNNPNSNTSNAGSSADRTITLGISGDEQEWFKAAIVPAFKAKYPELNLKVSIVSNSLYDITSKYTALAAAKKMPDVIVGSEKLPFIVQQGWAYPLDNLLAADNDKDDVLEAGLSRFKYNGHLYALPWRIQFHGIIVNLELLEELNLKKPGHNWTIDQFIDLAKKATTKETSGIESVDWSSNLTWELENKLMNAMMPVGYDQSGFNFSTYQFDFKKDNAWVETQKIMKELRTYPGLIAENLRDYSLRNAGKPDDYDKKFGRNADAFALGKVLMANMSTWQASNANNRLSGAWDLYPVPTKSGLKQRVQTHVDFVYMNSAISTEAKAKNAYKLVKFLSYDADCNMANLKYMESNFSKGKYSVIIPATENKEVAKKFASMNKVPAGIRYMYDMVVNNPTQTIVADCDKVVPDYWQNVTQYSSQVDKKIASGADPASLVDDFQTKVNAAMKSSWNALQKKIDKNYQTFISEHPWEK